MNPKLSADGKHLLYDTPHGYKSTSRDQLHTLVLLVLGFCADGADSDTDDSLGTILPILDTVEWSATKDYLETFVDEGQRYLTVRFAAGLTLTAQGRALEKKVTLYQEILEDWERKRA